MKIETTTDQARTVIADQLKDFAEKAHAAHQLFLSGKTKEAYRMFPYEHDVSENLEVFADEAANPISP